MKKINTQDEWIKRATEVLPAAGFGNFENDIIIKSGKAVSYTHLTLPTKRIV